MAYDLTNFVPQDGFNFGGTEVMVYVTNASEIKSEPKSKAQVVNTNTALGDTNIIAEKYDFTGAPAGKGYFRGMRVISDTGEIHTDLTVKDATNKIKNTFKFKLKGFSAAEKEFAELLAGSSGLVLLIEDRNGVIHEFGRKKMPATVLSAKGGAGNEFRGFEYELEYMGRVVRTYPNDLDIDVTPNT
jgi:hypothetical protein